MKLRNFSPIVISLLVGAALGYCLGPASSPAPAPEPEQKVETEQVKQPECRGERADRALRARIKELEGMLAKQGIEVEKMKAQFRRHRLERAQSKIDFLSSIDTSRMSPAMLKVHSDLQDMIEKREAVEEKMRGFMDMTDEERREAFQEIGEIDGKIRELSRAERDNLLVQTAEALGFQGDDAAEIMDTIKSIYEATDSGWGWGGPGGGGRRGGRGGRGGPGGRGGNR